MKRFVGLLILIIVLVAVSGCTQQTKTTPVTTTIATEVPTQVATTIETSVAPTAVATTEAPVTETTVVTNVTVPAAANTTNTTSVVVEKTTIVTAGMTPSTKVTVVHIANNTFTPSPLMVLPGTRITWINDDNTVHSLKTIGTYKGKFNSGDIAPKSQWGYDFSETEGTYEYADGYNMNVTGIIIVKKGDSFFGMGTPTTYMTSNATW